MSHPDSPDAEPTGDLPPSSVPPERAESSPQEADSPADRPDGVGEPLFDFDYEHDPHSQAAKDEPAWLEEDDFTAGDERPSMRSIGPGFLESLAWMGGAFFLQIVGMIAAVVVVVAVIVIDQSRGGPTFDMDKLQTPKEVMRLFADYSDIFLSVIQAVMVAGAVVAVSFRLGPQRMRRLSLRGIRWRHLAVVLVTMLPMLVLSSNLAFIFQEGWQRLSEMLTGSPSEDGSEVMEFLQGMAAQTPLFVLLLIIAVAPAVWEELVFRGVIGRGLIARYGLTTGVLLTAVLFAIMHLNPIQVAALIPLSLFLHISYLATRSFWVPMMVHFLNNALAVVLLKLALSSPETAQAIGGEPSMGHAVVLALAAGVSAVAMIRLLWKMRLKFIQADGTVWDPGYPTAESPPEDIASVPVCGRPAGSDWLAAGFGLVTLFVVAVLVNNTGITP